MPHLSEEKTLGANVNYLEACSTPNKTYTAAKNDHHKYHEREQPFVQQQIPDLITKDTALCLLNVVYTV